MAEAGLQVGNKQAEAVMANAVVLGVLSHLLML